MAEKTGKPAARRRGPLPRHRDLPAEHQQPLLKSDPSPTRKSFRNSGAIRELAVESWRLTKSKMRRLVPIAMLCLIAAARPAAAQSVLPSSFANWSASGPAALTPSGLSSLEPLGGPDFGILKEYSLKSTEMRAYTHGA